MRIHVTSGTVSAMWPIAIPGSVSIRPRPLKIATSGTSSATPGSMYASITAGVRRAPAREAQAWRSRTHPSSPRSVVTIAAVVETRRLLRRPASKYGIRMSWSKATVVGAGGRTCGSGEQVDPPLQRPEDDDDAERDDDQQHDAECEQRRHDSCARVPGGPGSGRARAGRGRRAWPTTQAQNGKPNGLAIWTSSRTAAHDDERCSRDSAMARGRGAARPSRRRKPLARPLVRSRASTTTKAVTM